MVALLCKKRPCRAPSVASVSCPVCGTIYTRCAEHDGEKGARRSLHSHMALAHPKKQGD